MKEAIKKLLPKALRQKLYHHINLYTSRFRGYHWSQEGEDIILQRLFERQNKGFYVDVGAHHPFRFSNTYFFYRKGWRGINIDANPQSISLFKRFRKKDINLHFAVGLREGKMKYYMFNEPALNTFDELLARERELLPNYKVIKTLEMEILPLEKILDRYLPQKQTIDFMSIDVEGLDLEVLRSNNWNKYRPSFLLVEILPAHSIEEVLQHDIYKYVSNLGYELFAKFANTCIFKTK